MQCLSNTLVLFTLWFIVIFGINLSHCSTMNCHLSHCTLNSNSSKPPSVSSESFTVDWLFHYHHWPLSSSISSTHSCSFTHCLSLSLSPQFSSAWPKAVLQTQIHQHVINHSYPFNLQPQPLVLCSPCTILPSSRSKWLPCRKYEWLTDFRFTLSTSV